MKPTLMTGAALVMFAAAPALAGHSTKAEIEATRQLNLQASQNAAPAPSTAQQTPVTDTVAMNTPPSAAPTMPVQTVAIDSNAILSSLNNPPSKIATANVLDSSGKVVGAVQKVEVNPQGQPTRVSVALIGKDEKMVVLDAGAVRYDVVKNEISADATGDQMKAMADKS
jgi:sporulation protein YlmC with PRC-barrel domain